jgi:signal transduction histidine kinase
VLNLSGMLVLIIVGVLSINVVSDTGLWPLVAMLSIGNLVAFVPFISDWGPQSHAQLKVLLWLQAILIVTLYFMVSVSFIAILSIIWIVQATEMYAARTASILLAACVTVFAASQLYHWYGIDTVDAIVNAVTLGLFHLFAFGATRRAIKEKQLREETGVLNRELVATRELLSQSTRQNERLRIARDLHDILGHHMTALILNLEVANHCTEGKAQEKVELSLALAKLLLGDLRSAVGELREEDVIDLQQSINKLVADIPNLNIEVDFSTAPSISNVDLAETLLRCTQEAVTNVLRHSKAANCTINVSQIENSCVLTVTDDGSDTAVIEPGNGLKGMAERVNNYGGSLSWQQSSKGFDLTIQLPMGNG